MDVPFIGIDGCYVCMLMNDERVDVAISDEYFDAETKKALNAEDPAYQELFHITRTRVQRLITEFFTVVTDIDTIPPGVDRQDTLGRSAITKEAASRLLCYVGYPCLDPFKEKLSADNLQSMTDRQWEAAAEITGYRILMYSGAGVDVARFETIYNKAREDLGQSLSSVVDICFPSKGKYNLKTGAPHKSIKKVASLILEIQKLDTMEALQVADVMDCALNEMIEDIIQTNQYKTMLSILNTKNKPLQSEWKQRNPQQWNKVVHGLYKYHLTIQKRQDTRLSEAWKQRLSHLETAWPKHLQYTMRRFFLVKAINARQDKNLRDYLKDLRERLATVCDVLKYQFARNFAQLYRYDVAKKLRCLVIFSSLFLKPDIADKLLRITEVNIDERTEKDLFLCYMALVLHTMNGHADDICVLTEQEDNKLAPKKVDYEDVFQLPARFDAVPLHPVPSLYRKFPNRSLEVACKGIRFWAMAKTGRGSKTVNGKPSAKNLTDMKQGLRRSYDDVANSAVSLYRGHDSAENEGDAEDEEDKDDADVEEKVENPVVKIELVDDIPRQPDVSIEPKKLDDLGQGFSIEKYLQWNKIPTRKPQYLERENKIVKEHKKSPFYIWQTMEISQVSSRSVSRGDMLRYLPTLTVKEIQERRGLVRDKLGFHEPMPKYQRMTPEQLLEMYNMYDTCFFDGLLSEYFNRHGCKVRIQANNDVRGHGRTTVTVPPGGGAILVDIDIGWKAMEETFRQKLEQVQYDGPAILTSHTEVYDPKHIDRHLRDMVADVFEHELVHAIVNVDLLDENPSAEYELQYVDAYTFKTPYLNAFHGFFFRDVFKRIFDGRSLRSMSFTPEEWTSIYLD